MRVLFVGDIYGRPGRTILTAKARELRERLRLDLLIVNGENAAGGFGITPDICREFYEAGVDGITLGNHAFDQKEILGFLAEDPHIVRPLNYPPQTAGRGYMHLETAAGARALILNVMGRKYMDLVDDPFRLSDEIISRHPLGSAVQFLLVDFHAETTSEKTGFAYHVDGRASVVVGTHTHVPTADARILPRGTAFQSDVGMTGDYNSIIGADTVEPLRRFTTGLNFGRLEPANGAATLCGLMIETDDVTGLAKHVARVCLGPHLQESWPGF